MIIVNYVTNYLTIKGSEKKEEVSAILDILNEDFDLDFNNIIECSKDLDIPESSRTYDAYWLYFKLQNLNIFEREIYKKELIEKKGLESFNELYLLGERAVKNKIKYNHINNYTYKAEKWGTSSNALDFVIKNKAKKYYKIKKKRVLKKELMKAKNIELIFKTLSNEPLKIYAALSSKFPELEFNVAYFNEDLGRNCGKLRIKKGKLIKIETDETHPTLCWMEFCFRLKNGYSIDSESDLYKNEGQSIKYKEDKASYGYNENWEYDEKVEESYCARQELKRKIEKFD